MSAQLKGQILIYSIVGCPFCLKAKTRIAELNLPYTDVSLEIYPQCRAEAVEHSGKKTVPQIFFNEVHIGGWEEFINLTDEVLAELIEKVKNNPVPDDAPVAPDPSTAVVDKDHSHTFTCELDEYASLVSDLKASGIIGDHRTGLLKVQKNSFIGKDFITWLTVNKCVDRARATEMGKELMNRNFGYAVSKNESEFADDGTVYRLMEDENADALNSGTSKCLTRPAAEVSEDLRKLILKIYSKNLSKDGKGVDYKAIANSAEFNEYTTATSELQRVELANLTRAEKLSFFINVYNALVIHANVVRGPPANLWQRYKFFNGVSYILGGNTYSLQDIENGVLRANRKGVGMLTKPFSKSDPRLRVAFDAPEPLIHFALVCGAKSCPPIKTYSAGDIDGEMQLACESFLEGGDGLKVDVETKVVWLSKIFQWYRSDFGNSNSDVVLWIYSHMSDCEQKAKLADVIRVNYKVKFMSYDWGINSK